MQPSVTAAAELIHLTNGLLAGAVAQQGKQNSQQYKDVLLNFLSGSAAGGRALLKIYEKDKCIDYQAQDMAIQAKQGVSIEERMHLRIVTLGCRQVELPLQSQCSQDGPSQPAAPAQVCREDGRDP